MCRHRRRGACALARSPAALLLPARESHCAARTCCTAFCTNRQATHASVPGMVVRQPSGSVAGGACSTSPCMLSSSPSPTACPLWMVGSSGWVTPSPPAASPRPAGRCLVRLRARPMGILQGRRQARHGAEMSRQSSAWRAAAPRPDSALTAWQAPQNRSKCTQRTRPTGAPSPSPRQ